MTNPFGTDAMASGYATSRPPIHPRVIELALRRKFHRALDIGCGAGVSTKALDGFAAHSIGLDPALAMLQFARGAWFVAGTAEAIPFRHRSFDLITAAGSLNYADLERFFPEAARVLLPDGVLLVYDFSPGRVSGDDEWFAAFHERYPPPAQEGRELTPEILVETATGFRLDRAQPFEIALTLTPQFYLNYMLTETNVASAVRRGVLLEEIRTWCAETLWNDGAREVVFRGYFVCLVTA
ncbi:MAG: ycgJ 2 [Candidatus Solibacter sp.]|jgi:SAM-dependent methyltransferase|nr:ycgJ 2 [Candidatus Solibacter sp.]